MLPDFQLVIDTVIESTGMLAPVELQYLQNTNTEIHIHATAPGGVNQSAIWTFNEVTNTHRGDIFISGNMVAMSVPATVNSLQGTNAGQKAIIKHELGHLLHAILHSSDFRMLTLRDESNGNLRTNPPITTILNNRPPNQGLAQWSYAGTHDSTREFVAEIFVALTSGLPISQQQYDWYIAHGGPEIAGRATPVTRANHVQVT